MDCHKNSHMGYGCACFRFCNASVMWSRWRSVTSTQKNGGRSRSCFFSGFFRTQNWPQELYRENSPMHLHLGITWFHLAPKTRAVFRGWNHRRFDQVVAINGHMITSMEDLPEEWSSYVEFDGLEDGLEGNKNNRWNQELRSGRPGACSSVCQTVRNLQMGCQMVNLFPGLQIARGFTMGIVSRRYCTKMYQGDQRSLTRGIEWNSCDLFETPNASKLWGSNCVWQSWLFLGV